MLYSVKVLSQNVLEPFVVFSDSENKENILQKACKMFCKYFLPVEGAFVFSRFGKDKSLGLYMYSESEGWILIAVFSDPKPFGLAA